MQFDVEGSARTKPKFMDELAQITSYKEIEEVMRSADFHQSGAPERRIFFGDTLIFAEGERHAELKARLRSLMSRESMAYYEFHLLEPVIRSTLDGLVSARSEDGLVRAELVSLARTMLHKISAGVTGVDGVDTPERTDRFAALITKLSEAVSGQWTRRPMEELVAEGRAALATLVKEYLRPSLDRRIALRDELDRGEIAREDLPRDLLMTMCLADDLDLSEDELQIPYVWRQCSLFLSAAIHTTSQSVPHLLVHLDEWTRAHPEDRVKILDPAFLRQAANESLRLHQSSPAKFRVATKDIVLSSGRSVRAGETVALVTTQANLSEEIFGAEPESFDPYRGRPAGQMPWGLTFGSGRHMCFGSNLVIGVGGKADAKTGSDGTLVKIARMMLEHGCRLDPDRPPVATSASFHDAFESVYVIFDNL